MSGPEKNLSDEVKELREKMARQAYASDKTNARSWTGRTQHDLTAFHRFFFQFLAACHWVWSRMVWPTLRFLGKPVRWLWHLFRLLWDKVVYVEDAFQNRLFSKTRAGVFLAASAIFCWYLVVPLLGILFDTGVYLATKRHETVYLTNSQEILPEENEHSVQGCYGLPCSDENSIYFRIRPSYFNQLWSLFHGRGFFFPDYVAAAVPVSISKCTITSYGIRVKFLRRGLDLFPDLVEAQCDPLLGEKPPEPAG